MWLILVCLAGQTGDCDDHAMAHARAANWRAEVALAGELKEWGGRRNTWERPSSRAGVDAEARYSSRADCLAALRRALPERTDNDGGHIREVTHGPDSVVSLEYYVPPPTPVGVIEYACFLEERSAE